MSLRVKSLSKVYGSQKAVENISFSVEKGEIVGFLGPNGAGKSTTMKIATNYLPATSGTVLVNEMDVTLHPLRVKQLVGYLPEHNPLYLDMYMHEYLRFVGGIYGLSSQRLRDQVGRMIEMCGLSAEQNKLIGSLSKGYRQRVGLAQALIHDPEVLILDEPTSGLDPNQIQEIRKLIKEVSKNKTVIFSTHIMQEVQALCDRVVIINKGKIVADSRLSDLLTKNTKPSLIVTFDKQVALEELKLIEGVDSVNKHNNTFHISSSSHVDVRQSIFRFASEKGVTLVELRQEENSLEEIFRSLTIEESVS